MNDVEVCVVAYGSERTIEACIESVAERVPGSRIALCDNHPLLSSVEPAGAVARTMAIPFRALRRPDNPGFGVACNELAATSTADWLLFLNPDASILSFPVLEQLGPGIAGPRTKFANGRRQHNYGRRRTLLDEIARRLQIPPREPNGAGYVSGAAILIRRKEFEYVGGFDERFFMYYEDIDLCRRVVESGSNVRIVPDFRVRHVGAHSASADPRTAALRSYRSARAYHEKWSGSSRAFDALVLVDSALRVGLRRVHMPVPGADGASATFREARRHLRRGGPTGDQA